MAPMKLTLVGTREGKPSLHWRGLLAYFVVCMVSFTLARFAVGWAWNLAFRDDAQEGWISRVLFPLFLSTFFTVLAVRRARSIPPERLPTLDRRSA